VYIMKAVQSCFMLERHEVCRAFSRACAKAGSSIDARIEMIAMTTSSSIKRERSVFTLRWTYGADYSAAAVRPESKGETSRGYSFSCSKKQWHKTQLGNGMQGENDSCCSAR
jgi:hypothetical protein